MNKRDFKRINNKKGYTILLIMIILLLTIYWQVASGSSVLISLAGAQKTEMKINGIAIDMTEIPEFELRK